MRFVLWKIIRLLWIVHCSDKFIFGCNNYKVNSRNTIILPLHSYHYKAKYLRFVPAPCWVMSPSIPAISSFRCLRFSVGWKLSLIDVILLILISLPCIWQQTTQLDANVTLQEFIIGFPLVNKRCFITALHVSLLCHTYELPNITNAVEIPWFLIL